MENFLTRENPLLFKKGRFMHPNYSLLSIPCTLPLIDRCKFKYFFTSLKWKEKLKPYLFLC